MSTDFTSQHFYRLLYLYPDGASVSCAHQSNPYSAFSRERVVCSVPLNQEQMVVLQLECQTLSLH